MRWLVRREASIAGNPEIAGRKVWRDVEEGGGQHARARGRYRVII